MLNRTQIYASARRRVTLTWPLRLALRIIPILLFLTHTIDLLQAMRCQTSPHFSYLKYGKADKYVSLDFSGEGGVLYRLGSLLLFWEGDAESCLAVGMIPPKTEIWDRRGSLSLLWPFFQSLCLGQFIETLSCAVQGRSLMTETGMSIFEHSLAFAEVEAMISNQLGLSVFGSPTKGVTPTPAQPEGDSNIIQLLTRSELFRLLNTPPELLLMGVISSLNNLSSQVLGLLNMQARFRLVNTGIWGLCFMGAFVWGFFSLRPESGPDSIILRFPAVCIIGFIPHLLILIGISLCASIYSLALLLCFLSPPDEGQQPHSVADRFRLARENLQANAQLSNIRLNLHEDFYSALLRIGFTALTVASEAVYLNEAQRVSVARLTWLEEESMKEIDAFEQSNDPSHRLSVHLEGLKANDFPDPGTPKSWTSGYSRQTSIKAVQSGRSVARRGTGGDGVGHMQRGGRYFMAGEFFLGIFWLLVSWLRLVANKSLDQLGVVRRPRWLQSPRRKDGFQERPEARGQNAQPESLQFWLLSDEGEMSLPANDDVDVEYETKKRLRYDTEGWGEEDEAKLDTNLYGWWKSGGWWGEKDESGLYQTSSQDDDTTSVVSMSTNASEAYHEDRNDDEMDIDEGASTPTQRHPYLQSRPYSPTTMTDHTLDPQHLAELLDPKDQSTRSEARMLAHHLTAPRVTTRSQYRQAQSSGNSRLLTSTRYRPTSLNLPSGKLSANEEAQLLEHLILTRRSQPLSSNGQSTNSWRDGAAGLGAGGPQCVVCQSEPRTVLAWPCRCLSLCEECRVSLAMNNFGTCVCCRQDVVGFSRLFVP